jgi:hypothetical protein
VSSAAVPEAKATTMPGTKWWMWRPPRLTLGNGHQPLRIPQVEILTRAKEPRKPARRLKRTASLRSASS